jgi:hypothetical protein
METPQLYVSVYVFEEPLPINGSGHVDAEK